MEYVLSVFLNVLLSAFLGLAAPGCAADSCATSADLHAFVAGKGNQNRNEVVIEIQNANGNEKIQIEGGPLITRTWNLVAGGFYTTTFEPVGLKHWRVDNAKTCGSSHKWWSVNTSNCWFEAKPPSTLLSGDLRNLVIIQLTGATGKEKIQVQGGSIFTPTWDLRDSVQGIYETLFDPYGLSFWTIDGGGSCESHHYWWDPDPSSCWFAAKPAEMLVQGSARNVITVTLVGASGNEEIELQNGIFLKPIWGIDERAAGLIKTLYAPVGQRYWSMTGVEHCVSEHPLWKLTDNCWLEAAKATVTISGNADSVNITTTKASSLELIQVTGGALITPTWNLVDVEQGTYTTRFTPTKDLPAWTVTEVASCVSNSIFWFADQANCWFNRIWQPFEIYLPMVAR